MYDLMMVRHMSIVKVITVNQMHNVVNRILLERVINMNIISPRVQFFGKFNRSAACLTSVRHDNPFT